ncbi:hypothetical protein VNI00_008773 [Paramarasmius palmivorus]|uniref:Uncharacterized protein n=1 Tax=Paramarasmius palmivorus TaxID=297713 RepID=A0AAW0CXQ0_9AGAR
MSLAPVTNEQVLVDDILIDIFKDCLQRWGPQGRRDFMVFNRKISERHSRLKAAFLRILRTFYGIVQLTKAKSLLSLCQTILFNPDRLRYIHTMCAVLGPTRPLFPAFPTSIYPEGYNPVLDCDDPITAKEVEGLAHVIQACSSFLRNLAIVTQRQYPALGEQFGRLSLQRVTSLEVPAWLFVKLTPGQVPSMTHLRVSVDMDDPRFGEPFLEYQDFRGFQQLEHLYIAYGNVLGHENSIQVHLFDIRVGGAVQVVAVECDEGDSTALERPTMLDYVAHPCVVLVMHDRCVEDEIDRLVSSQGFPQQPLLMERLNDMILGLSTDQCTCVWEPLKEKVASRWRDFEERYDDDEKAEVLASSELFVYM